jgi:hypothetical protein
MNRTVLLSAASPNQSGQVDRSAGTETHAHSTLSGEFEECWRKRQRTEGQPLDGVKAASKFNVTSSSRREDELVVR